MASERVQSDGSHLSGSLFRARPIHCLVPSLQHQLLFCLQHKPLQSAAESLWGVGQNLTPGTQELLGVGFFDFPLTLWRLTQPEARPWARHTGGRSETEVKEVPGWDVLLTAEPLSNVRSAEEQTPLSSSNQQELLLGVRQPS